MPIHLVPYRIPIGRPFGSGFGKLTDGWNVQVIDLQKRRDSGLGAKPKRKRRCDPSQRLTLISPFPYFSVASSLC